MIKKVTTILTEYPSYMRWGNKRLAAYLDCSERTIKRIKADLKPILTCYNQSFKNQN